MYIYVCIYLYVDIYTQKRERESPREKTTLLLGPHKTSEFPYSQQNGQYLVQKVMFSAGFASVSGKEGSVMNKIFHVHMIPPTDDQGFSKNLGLLLLGYTLVSNYPLACQALHLP